MSNLKIEWTLSGLLCDQPFSSPTAIPVVRLEQCQAALAAKEGLMLTREEFELLLRESTGLVPKALAVFDEQRQIIEALREKLEHWSEYWNGLTNILAAQRAAVLEEADEQTITVAMREADRVFEKVGGSTRHYVRDCLLPIMKKHGLIVVRDQVQERRP